MENSYGNIPSNQIEKQKRYYWGSLRGLLDMYDEGYPFLDARIQNLINQICGANALFDFDPIVLTIVSNLETARRDSAQFRKCILDAMGLIDQLKGGDSDV